jgi:hypothetical protein
MICLRSEITQCKIGSLDKGLFSTSTMDSTSKQTRYLRQGIKLTGLGASTFNASMQGILNVFTLFSNHVPRDALKSCENICNTFGQHMSIDLSNCYFSSIRNVPLERSVPFGRHVDPYGILARLQTPNYVHSELNEVRYYERISKSSGKTQ